MDLVQQQEVHCPYCGEMVAVAFEADLAGELIQDCEVCCRPWSLRLTWAEGKLHIEAERLDD